VLTQIGEEVLFHGQQKWIKAEVAATWASDNVTLVHEEGSTVAQHGAHIHGWLTYEEAAQYAREHPAA
jgi:hypothetical protein